MNTSWNGFEECVVDVCKVGGSDCRTESDANSRIGIDNETGSHQRVATIEVELDAVACKFSEIWAHLISEDGLVAIDTHDAVAYLHSCLGCRTVV